MNRKRMSRSTNLIEHNTSTRPALATLRLKKAIRTPTPQFANSLYISLWIPKLYFIHKHTQRTGKAGLNLNFQQNQFNHFPLFSP
ncbi:hypothetical protein L6452_23670 [Arctium lappa]|uniref:Uncharacterized protein n=1 Tax=Arctium lappa TaxID=4217 RepID=A0ACB9B1I3_ARCLA|nr:hypothetical protein L6452_23670 [Arctium lappa]